MRILRHLALVVLAIPLFAQKITPIEVSVDRISDRRTKGHFSHLTIDLELPKIQSADVAASRVLITSASDDTGRNLIQEDSSEPRLEPNHMQSMMSGQKNTRPVSVSVMLANPERKATKVKEVRGEIELFMPGKDPNSVAEIPKFLSQSGKVLSHKALKGNGVEIALLSSAQVASERKRLGDAKRKEYKSSGFEDGPDLDSTIQSYLESALSVDESDVLVRIKDPNQRIQEIVYVDATGETKRISTRDEEGLTYWTTWGEKPKPDWKLKVSMKTSKNLLRHSFALADVVLP